MRPAHFTDEMEQKLNEEIANFTPETSEEIIRFWNKNDALIVLLRHRQIPTNQYSQIVYTIVRGFWLGDKPGVSVDESCVQSEILLCKLARKSYDGVD